MAIEFEKLKAERATWEAEREKKTLEEIDRRQKQFEDRMASNYERLYEEVMRLSAEKLANIKDKRERQEEINTPGLTGVEVLDKMERQEEAATAAMIRLRKGEGEGEEDDAPRMDDIDYVTELEISAEK